MALLSGVPHPPHGSNPSRPGGLSRLGVLEVSKYPSRSHGLGAPMVSLHKSGYRLGHQVPTGVVLVVDQTSSPPDVSTCQVNLLTRGMRVTFSGGEKS